MRFSLSMDEDLYLLLQNRAMYNKRSMAKELIYLIEAALAAESAGNIDILRNLVMATGGIEGLSSNSTRIE